MDTGGGMMLFEATAALAVLLLILHVTNPETSRRVRRMVRRTPPVYCKDCEHCESPDRILSMCNAAPTEEADQVLGPQKHRVQCYRRNAYFDCPYFSAKKVG